jgi:iron complex outermembrane receptor protein
MFDRRVVHVLATLAGLVVPALGSAQNGTVTGTVTESRANLPVGGARVQAVSATTVVAATQSRDDGTYRLSLPAGTYTIIANRIGYRPGNASVTVTAGASATANVALAEAIVELNPVVTVASRKEEKALDAPASVAVIEVRAIQERPAVTAADHIQGMPGVDVSKGGVAQSNIVTRGFNNAFSGSLLTLQDYRFAGVPSLRVNVPLLFTSTSEDIERIEVLLGPASALYGPNSSHGVLHIITKSPFTSQGTTVTLDGGTRSLFRAAARHAGLIGDKFGFKLSGEAFRAKDFEFHDAGEPATFPNDPAVPAGRRGQPNERDFDIERMVGEARIDYRPNENSEFVTTYGMSRIGSGLEYTGGQGTAQAKNWSFQSIQHRARIGRLFGQVFLNISDAGNDNGSSTDGTFLLASGQPIVDQSRSWAAQLQHGLSIGAKQDFVYGVDYISTNPRTANTINGRNEDVDDVIEYGGYVQSTTRLTPKFDFIAAVRLDKNDQVDGYQTSPRAAVIFKPSETQNFRFTFNRAFQTPGNFTWFLDLIRARQLGGLPYNIRVLGNPPKRGWTFNRTCVSTVNDGLCMKSIFTPDSSAWVPASAASAFPGVIAANATAITAGLTQQISAALQAAPFNMSPQQAAGAAGVVAPQVTGFLRTLQPTPAQLASEMRMFPPGSPNITAGQVRDIGPIKASFNNTYEIGYKGIIGSKLRVAIDAWREKRGDVGNPAALTTPNIFFSRTSLSTYVGTALVPALTQALMGPPFNYPQQQAAGVAQQFAPVIAGGLAGHFAPLPLGIVSFNDARFASATDVFATYASFDTTVTVNGIDVGVDFVASDNWSFNGTMSWVDNDSFPEVQSSNSRPLMLNAPTNKLSLGSQYRSTTGAWGVDARVRYANAYQVNTGTYATDVDYPIPGATGTYRYDDIIKSATIFDLGFNYRFAPGGKSALFSIRADNLFDTKYRTMPGTPELGMMLVTRLQYSF